MSVENPTTLGEIDKRIRQIDRVLTLANQETNPNRVREYFPIVPNPDADPQSEFDSVYEKIKAREGYINGVKNDVIPNLHRIREEQTRKAIPLKMEELARLMQLGLTTPEEEEYTLRLAEKLALSTNSEEYSPELVRQTAPVLSNTSNTPNSTETQGKAKEESAQFPELEKLGETPIILPTVEELGIRGKLDTRYYGFVKPRLEAGMPFDTRAEAIFIYGDASEQNRRKVTIGLRPQLARKFRKIGREMPRFRAKKTQQDIALEPDSMESVNHQPTAELTESGSTADKSEILTGLEFLNGIDFVSRLDTTNGATVDNTDEETRPEVAMPYGTKFSILPESEAPRPRGYVDLDSKEPPTNEEGNETPDEIKIFDVLLSAKAEKRQLGIDKLAQLAFGDEITNGTLTRKGANQKVIHIIPKLNALLKQYDAEIRNTAGRGKAIYKLEASTSEAVIESIRNEILSVKKESLRQNGIDTQQSPNEDTTHAPEKEDLREIILNDDNNRLAVSFEGRNILLNYKQERQLLEHLANPRLAGRELTPNQLAEPEASGQDINRAMRNFRNLQAYFDDPKNPTLFVITGTLSRPKFMFKGKVVIV